MQPSNDHLREAGAGAQSAVGHRAAQGLGSAEASAGHGGGEALYGEPAHGAPAQGELAHPAPAYDDPWYDALASGWAETAGPAVPEAPVPGPPAPRRPSHGAPATSTGGVGGDTDPGACAGAAAPAAVTAEVYLEVQRSAAFRDVRGRYRGFVVPAGIGFLVWYLGYVVTATTAPGLMGRPVAGALNVGMLAGLGQFLTTFLLTWAYSRHARHRRDRAALELRWHTQERARVRGGAA